jgi:hypothetical protein
VTDNTKLTKTVIHCHQNLDELFLLHQEAVVMGSFDDATQLFDCFHDLHSLHMTFEDEKLLPELYRLDDPGRWPASLYTSEHSKVEELMGKTRNRLLSLSKGAHSHANPRREIIALLDWEKTLKGVCEHHQEREEQGLLPALDEQTDSEWRASIIEAFIYEWNDCADRNMHIVNGMTFPQRKWDGIFQDSTGIPNGDFPDKRSATGEE